MIRLFAKNGEHVHKKERDLPQFKIFDSKENKMEEPYKLVMIISSVKEAQCSTESSAFSKQL